LPRSPFPGLHRKLKPYALALLNYANEIAPGRVYVSSVRRSKKTQLGLYLDWITGRSRYPAAKPGTSKHERGRAFDLGGLSASQQRQLGAAWKSWGGRWGGDFSNSDPIHFEG
jgi:hypothetical protein